MKRTRSSRTIVGTAILSLVLPLVAVATGATAAPAGVAGPRALREVRTIWTAEFGIAHPSGVAFSPARGEFLVAGPGGSTTRLVRLSPTEDLLGRLRLPRLAAPSTLAFDAAGNRLTALTDGRRLAVPARQLERARPTPTRVDVSALGLRDPRGATYDPARGTWYVLDAAAPAIVRVPAEGGLSAATRIPLTIRGGLRGLAFNPADGLLYVLAAEDEVLYGVDGTGSVRSRYDVSGLHLTSPRGMTFAPSADATDARSTQHLFIADARSASGPGRVVEATLEQVTAAAAPTVTATLVQTIATSAWVPGSPDPSGVVYLPGRDRLEVVDSEVEEVTGAGYHGVNLWQSTRSGTVTDTGTTYPAFSKEPTGLGYDPGSDTLFISDDSADRVWMVKPGSDGRHGTPDDLLTYVSAGPYGSGDTEDPEFDTTTGQPTSGHLFFLDGTNREVYDINPVDGVFGNGNDTMTSFDVGVLGPTDWEGLSSDPSRNTLLVGARGTKEIYEVTKTGTLVRVIDLSGISGLRYVSGVGFAPASDGSGRWNYWIVDRAIDNGSNSSENDGRLFEVSVPGSDAPPTVSVTAPANGSTVTGSSVPVQASAADDNGVTSVQFFLDGATSLGTDTDGSNGWSVTWNSTTASEGSHALTAVATDTIGQTATSAAVTVTVDRTAPTVSITAPSAGQTVMATIPVTADATDATSAVTSVAFFVDGSTSIGTDTNGANGWSVSWNTATVGNGSRQLTAVATDRAGNTASSSAVPVVVDNPLVLDIPIATSTDDVEEYARKGNIITGSSDLDMLHTGSTQQSGIGLRFTGVSVPQGAIIETAWVQFQTDAVGSAAVSFTLKAQASDNAPPFTTAKYNVTSRATGSVAVDWQPPPWTVIGERGPAQRTPELNAMIQEVVSRTGWAPGNAIVIAITGPVGTNSRTAEAFDGTFAPVLHIEYAMP
jgi:uncharacterized protein YjiK